MVIPVPHRSLSFAVIIPMYNEQIGAERCVRAVSAALAEIDVPAEIIAIDDGSTDGTGEILGSLGTEGLPLIVIEHPANAGYGKALYTGVAEAIRRKHDYVLFMDSDLTNDPKYLPRFVDKMIMGFDVIKATRYAEGGGVEGVAWWKLAISVVGNHMAKLLLDMPISDCTNGFRAVKTKLLAGFEPRENGFAVIMEELFYLRHLTDQFCEVPYILRTRGEGMVESRFSFRPRTFWDYLKYPLRWGIGRKFTAAELHLNREKTSNDR